MRQLHVINDLHIGVQRQAGTTGDSSYALRQYALSMFSRLLYSTPDGADVVVNGDLTDAFDIPLSDALDMYEVASGFLSRRPDTGMTWAMGNHDLSKDSDKLGTVAFISALLSMSFPDRFRVVREPAEVAPKVYVIPHMANQDLFDLELSRVPDGTKYLLLHCNFDNPFAGAQDHSLNLSRETASALIDRGITLILGHEHQGRTAFRDKLIIVGNQFPTSVSDCLQHGDGQADGVKYSLLVSPDTDSCELVPTWWASKSFRDVDWKDVSTLNHLIDVNFVRVSGRATQEEAEAANKAVLFLRNTFREVFVVSNAVQMQTSTSDDGEFIAESLESIRQIDVMQLLLGQLTEDQQAVIRPLLEQA